MSAVPNALPNPRQTEFRLIQTNIEQVYLELYSFRFPHQTWRSSACQRCFDGKALLFRQVFSNQFEHEPASGHDRTRGVARIELPGDAILIEEMLAALKASVALSVDLPEPFGPAIMASAGKCQAACRSGNWRRIS